MAVAEKTPLVVVKETIVDKIKTIKLNMATPSYWWVFSDDGTKLKYHEAEVCHAGMQHDTPNTYDNLITVCPQLNAKGLAFEKFLMSGPFRAYSDLISLEHVEDETYYFKVQHLDKWPANVIYNFCIASRLPLEHSTVLANWYDMQKEGVDPGISLLIASSNVMDKSEDVWVRKVPNNYTVPYRHYMFDCTLDWVSIIMGEMDWNSVSKHDYKSHPGSCVPTNKIWGKLNPISFNETLKGKTVLELSQQYGLQTEKPKPAPKRTRSYAKKPQGLVFNGAEWPGNAGAEGVPLPQPHVIHGGFVEEVEQVNWVQFEAAHIAAVNFHENAIHAQMQANMAQPPQPAVVVEDDPFDHFWDEEPEPEEADG